jgi:hypothetical protein
VRESELVRDIVRESVYVCERVCMCVRERKRESVCVCERERKREGEGVYVCERERENVIHDQLPQTFVNLSLRSKLSPQAVSNVQLFCPTGETKPVSSVWPITILLPF